MNTVSDLGLTAYQNATIRGRDKVMDHLKEKGAKTDIPMPITPAAMVDTIKARSYDFNPGERYLYNNSGFYLLGYLVEKISGKSLANYLQETFFKPLGMNNTGIYETNRLLENDYGYGWSLQDYRGNKFISHGGGLHGFLSFLERQPEKKVTVVVLCNSTPPPVGIEPASNALLITEYLLWADMSKQSSFASDFSVDENILKDMLAGTITDKAKLLFKINYLVYTIHVIVNKLKKINPVFLAFPKCKLVSDITL